METFGDGGRDLRRAERELRPADVSDDELVAMYAGGDADAFDALFDRHHVAAYNLARFMLGDPGGAEEIMQETFIVLVRAAKRYEARGRFRAWLMGIVRNRCLVRVEAARARRAVMAESGFDFAEPASREPDPPERMGRDERAERMRRAIADLPERQREAILLYAYEDMAYREIAETLGTPINTVKTLIHRARASLARGLSRGRKGEAPCGVR